MNSPNEYMLRERVKQVSWRTYLTDWRDKLQEQWIFRGQTYQESEEIVLRSSLERALSSYDIDLSKAPEIEDCMIREFRRKYEGNDSQLVIDDTLYCLSLMQHHGCPTRLLDFTYSPYIAAFFAVENMSIEEKKTRDPIVFCFNHKWINEAARMNINKDDLFKKRFLDGTINDKSFKPLYMEKKGNFIVPENPHTLHRRLSIQRGVFIIQGNISESMMKNIVSMDGWQNDENLIIYKLEINKRKQLKEVYEDLRLMNLTNESLFPGLDGFSRSLKQNLYLHEDLKRMKAETYPFK